MATRADVDNLKQEWDGSWDIEDAEGFEEYREELLAFRKGQEAEWQARRAAEMAKYAEKIGVPGDLATAESHGHGMAMRDYWMDQAKTNLLYYLGNHVITGGAENRADCRAEIALIVDYIVQAAEASLQAHIALELAKAR